MYGLLTLHQAAQLLTVDLSIVNDLIRQGFLPCIDGGHEVYVPYQAAMNLLIYLLYLAVLKHPDATGMRRHAVIDA